MHHEVTVEINAPAETVWRLLEDVERWPEWTASIDRVERLTQGPFGEGSKARVHQPKLPAAVWTVTDFDPGRSFTWAARTPGLTTVASHDVTTHADGTVSVRLVLDQTGPLAFLVALLAGARSRRYVAMEAAGLKRKAELQQ
ncbi:SRPBCC family protein [Actinomadura rudentiformis]|uniref:Polyketide cyclase n=1 Tax=Actinomadura rudentiformis TaxID=359158 RepID=A0A6H9YTZ2_9ACTN|nr:SRPBCC family protein [Actinomadura rudentiformis]KAB2345614.1 polyketide cyclase [Actinomadura rudentiformis]